MAAGFHHVEVLTVPSGLKLVYWRMDRHFNPTPHPALFIVDFARSAGPWTPLNEAHPVENNCFYADAAKRSWDNQKNIWYRIRAFVSGGLVATSIPCQALGSLTDEEYLTGKEVVRSVNVGLKKRGGKQGFLLIRKEWGPKCPLCADYDTFASTRGDCPKCFGTAIDGGYYPGIEYWVNSQPPMRNRELKADATGVADPQDRQVYGVAYPWITSTNLWVDAKSNERYIIRQVKAMAEIASKPLVIMMVMRRMPETSPAMEVPIAAPLEQFEDEVQECPSEVAPLTQNFPDLSKEIVKSKEAADDQGWRRGLKTEPW